MVALGRRQASGAHDPARPAEDRRLLSRPRERAQLLLVCSSGGHLLQLLALRDAWEDFPRLWVTLAAADSRVLLVGEEVVYAHGPTNRSVTNLIRNLGLAVTVVRRARPRAIVTTGAGIAVPFAWIGRIFGARVVYVESLSRIDRPSLSYRLMAPVVARVYVQWPELARALPGSRFLGTVFDRA